jgi:hypothetical protein
MRQMRFRSHLHIALLFFLLLQTLSLRADRYLPQDYDNSEAYRVYSALLSSKYFAKETTLRYVIEAETTSPQELFSECFPSQDNLGFSDWQTFLDLKKEGQVPRILENNFEPTARYQVVPRNLLYAQLNGEGVLWGGFHKHYPDSAGIISISSVGFNENKDRALVYVSFTCGDLCSGAHFYTLEKRGNSWQIIEPAASCAIFY